MHERTLPLFILAFITILGVTNTLALYEMWYARVQNLDSVMHVAGGFFVGLSALYLYFASSYLRAFHGTGVFALVLSVLAATFVGVLWEFFEYILDQYRVSEGLSAMFQPGVGDSMAGLAFDMAGGTSAWFAYYTLLRRQNRNSASTGG